MAPSLTQRIRRSLRTPRRLRFTRQGKWFTTMTFLVGFGAINTGNNLLYLLLGMMIGMIIISGIMSEAVLRKLRVERLPIGPVFVGVQAHPRYRLRNGKRVIPSFSIEVREREASHRKLFQKPHHPRALFHYVEPRRESLSRGWMLPERRGLMRFEAVDLLTRFPFGFFEKSRTIERSSPILVYPRIVPAPPIDLPAGRPDGAIPRPAAGRGMEYYGLRDYLPNEDFRNIHWKISARRGEIVVREHEQERSRALHLVVYHVLRPNLQAPAALAGERTIEVAAAIARRFLEDQWTVSLATTAGLLESGRGPGQVERVYRTLALLEERLSEQPVPLAQIADTLPTVLITPSTGAPSLPSVRYDLVLRVSPTGEVA